MNKTDMKPCPVCKENKYLCYFKSLIFWHRWQIVCAKCEYYGPEVFSKRLAVWKWNRRVTDENSD